MKNLLRAFLFMSVLFSVETNLMSQTEKPNCTNVNAAVGADGYASIIAEDFIINAADAANFDITVENQWGGIIEYFPDVDETFEITISACAYLSQELKIVVKNTVGSCWSRLTFKQDNPPVIEGRSITVLCDDDLVFGGHIGGAPPDAEIPCEGTVTSQFVADWIVPYPCVLGNDTAKVIYREYEAFDKNGVRGTGYDTIVVFRFPEITLDNLYCVEKDTTYCGVGDFQGPYIVVFDPKINACRNVNLIDLVTSQPRVFDPKCGIQVGIAPPDEFNNACDEITKYTVDIKQTCYGQPTDFRVCNPVPAFAQNAEQLGEGYWRCTFWWVDLDTVGPTVNCETDHFAEVDGNIITVPTSSHDCVAHVTLPPASASDICREVKSVKAIVEGFGTFRLDLVGDEWVSDAVIKIPYSEEPTKIIYEALDDCHNVGKDSCYIRVKDRTRPVAVCDKGVNVSLTDKKVWVNAETFDEGSWDNCHIALMLARRSDWTTSCVDLEEGLRPFQNFEHYGSIYTSDLSTDKAEEPVEAHYQKQRDWLKEDGQACGDLISEAWRYGIMSYATVELAQSMDLETFDHVTEENGIFGDHDFDQVKQIGGGWSDAVPFECADACGPVTVELLVVDYWCNWSKCWTEVWVEDKTPVDVAKDVVDYVDITCKSYKSKDHLIDGELHPQSIEDLAARADAGDAAAFDKLDEIFGGYRKAWVDPYGNYVDEEGEVLDSDIIFSDSTCHCYPTSSTMTTYDDHFGWIEVTEEGRDCSYDVDEMDLNHGVVVVNCPENVFCEQDLWFNFDHCGQGKLVRRFKIWQGCPSSSTAHVPDTIFRYQTISVSNECALDEGMFTYPPDVTVDVCEVEYDADGSGNVGGAADPENTGRPEYIFDDDCRLVGIGYYDKVFRIVGGDEACFKVLRTWCFTDWCEITNGERQEGNWWEDPDYSGRIFKHVQKIILRDTVPPEVSIVEPVEGPAFEVAGCEFEFNTTATVADECGVLSYRWEILDVKADPVVVAKGAGDLNMDMADNFGIAPEDPLAPGLYKLKVIVVDDCQNEGIDTYEFSVVSTKKPTPVCITSITVELTPMELNDGDTDPDTAMGTVWAEEYNSSSEGACGNTNLTYLIDDGTGQPALPPASATQLELGCEHALLSPLMVRVYVVQDDGNWDYCEVMLIVQTNMGGCGDVSATNGVVTGTIETELEESVELVDVTAQLGNGQELNFITRASGAYTFAATLGLDVEIVPKKNTDHMNGISTADLVKMQKHILGKELLPTSHREVAADVNNDGKISALDLLDIRRLILGKVDELPNSDSWAFVNKVNGQKTYKIDALGSTMDVDFVGIKMGDLNISNDPSRGAGRTAKNMVLHVNDQEVSAGNVVKVDFRAGDFEDLEGYQFTLNFDPTALQLVDVDYGQSLELTAENFGLMLQEQGLASTSWSSAEAKTLAVDEILFSMSFNTLSDVRLSEVLTVNSRVTSAEAYDSGNELLGVALEFREGIHAENTFALHQNRPNPFRDHTSIGFMLPESMDATLTIYDISGKVIKMIEGEYAKGYNEISLRQSELNVGGVLYYQLDTEQHTATRKMVVIE